MARRLACVAGYGTVASLRSAAQAGRLCHVVRGILRLIVRLIKHRLQLLAVSRRQVFNRSQR